MSDDELISMLRAYQNWMKDGPDGGPSIGIDDMNGDEQFGEAADRIKALSDKLDKAMATLTYIAETSDDDHASKKAFVTLKELSDG